MRWTRISPAVAVKSRLRDIYYANIQARTQQLKFNSFAGRAEKEGGEGLKKKPCSGNSPCPLFPFSILTLESYINLYIPRFFKKDYPMKLLALVSVFIVSIVFSARSAAVGYEYTVYTTGVEIRIDGRPEETSWAAVDSTPMTVGLSHGEQAQIDSYDQTRRIYAKALWDSAALYLYMWMDEGHVWNTLSGRDTRGFWEEVTAEFTVDPDNDGANFAEIQVTAGGSVMDMLFRTGFDGVIENFDFDGITAAAHVAGTFCDSWSSSASCNADTDTGWGMELKIPFEGFRRSSVRCEQDVGDCAGKTGTDVNIEFLGDASSPPRPGDRWTANTFYLTNKPTPDDVSGAPFRKNFNWAPVAMEDFHAMDKFGTYAFSDSVAAKEQTAAEGPGGRGTGAGDRAGITVFIGGRAMRFPVPPGNERAVEIGVWSMSGRCIERRIVHGATVDMGTKVRPAGQAVVVSLRSDGYGFSYIIMPDIR
jgi:hypothetical protein